MSTDSDTSSPLEGDASARQGRLLIVDDEESIADMFATFLQSALGGIPVDIATDGRQAVELFKRNSHTIVVTDVEMPVMNGAAVLREMEKVCREEQRAAPSRLFCTACPPSHEVKQILENDKRVGFLRKPVKSEDLVAAVKQCIRGGSNGDH